MFINTILKQTKANGPGTRYAIWFQGCTIRCTGCTNQAMWDLNKGDIWTPERLLDDIMQSSQYIEGITLTGGEPLDQYEEVLTFLKMAYPLYHIFLTSGYNYEAIKAIFPQILNYVDILVYGPFIKELIDETPAWRGSTNQGIYYLTDRSKKFKDKKYMAEIIIKENGDSVVTGFAIPKFIKDMHA